jgi:hypothetical protein
MSAKGPSRGRGIRRLCRALAVAVAPVDQLEIVIGKGGSRSRRAPAPRSGLPDYEQGVSGKRSTSPLAEVPKLVR